MIPFESLHAISILNILILFATFICIPVLIGVYVYRDASRRNMNAALWTLIAVLGPSFIGLIIYLLARSQYNDMECPRCGTAVTEQYLSCPKCGIKLKASCPDCGFAVEADWSVCPRCSLKLPEWEGGYMSPLIKKDKTLVKIIAIIVLIPVSLLILFGLFGLTGFVLHSGSGGDVYVVEESSGATAVQ